MQGIEERATEYQTKPTIVPTIADAVSVLTKEVLGVYKEHLKDVGREATTLLLRSREKIVAAVKEVKELSDLDLRQSGLAFALSGNLGERLDIGRVLSVDFQDIGSAVCKDREKLVSRILFKVNCTARVLASVIPPLSSKSTTFTVGGEKHATPFWAWAPREKPSERVIPIRFYGEAQVRKVQSDWEMESIKIDKKVDEEWAESYFEQV